MEPVTCLWGDCFYRWCYSLLAWRLNQTGLEICLWQATSGLSLPNWSGMIVAECCPLSPDEKHCMIILAARRLLQLPIIPTHCKHSLYSLQAILKLEMKNVLLQSKSKVSKLKYVLWQYFNNYSNHKEGFWCSTVYLFATNFMLPATFSIHPSNGCRIYPFPQWPAVTDCSPGLHE